MFISTGLVFGFGASLLSLAAYILVLFGISGLLVLSGAYFAERVSLGQLTVASIAFSQVQLSLSFQIDRADSFAGLFASLDRVGGGKQQRVSFARLLLQRPLLVVLDEATSALDLETEAHLYGLVCGGSTTVISVGHRPSLRAFHQRELRLDGVGGCSLEAIHAPNVRP